jgi:hypothetical protein
MSFLKSLSDSFAKIFASEQSKLGLPEGFPIKVCVGLDPEKYPASEATADRYLSAAYKGNGEWKVTDTSIDPDLMGTAIYANSPPRSVSTKDLIAEFDAKIAEYPAQKFTCYDETYFPDARAQLQGLIDASATSAPAAKQENNF